MHKIEKLKYDLIAFVAPQGGGKDTQMEILKASLPCETTALISMSDVLRHYRSTDREFDEQTSLMMARGILIGDDIVVGRLMKYIQEECRGKTTILLNGFPRTIAQAFGLWAIKCHVLGPQARVAILKFELSKEDAYKRCLKRIDQMRADGKQPRADDKPELIADRLDTYFQHQPEIMSGAALFADVIDIDASKEVAEVTEDIIKAISDSPASSID